MESSLSSRQQPPAKWGGSGEQNGHRRGSSEEKDARRTLDATYQEIPEPMEEGQFHRDR